MGIDYNIRLAGNITPDDLVELIAKHFSFSSVNDGLNVSITSASELSKELTSEQYGIDVVVSIYCSMDKLVLDGRGMKNFVDLFVGLLVLLDSDVVVDFNGEKPILFRRAGVAYVDLRERYWREKLKPKLDEFGVPFIEREMDVDQSLRN